ncbi:hypothetical protein CO180_03500 [candidate division WWE3 bacterium CG_4_9_14_3_um_filter_41_6]|uniref:Uncharacterized protein n=1 Tax=candidate division WWE3 bacterium CG_4_10_14_0_2_um_filter_41_14 TaxID=1975072 RepID=A0A2M7TJQ3_UNCKA|nr:MAG: hypothetical protein COY32_02790 [candidate division WWE3 bacterium CG_4_10_14_0_2_um_filter_41_14]PJA38458.1 MAG: hypothetical protein CO180_03500 [candidate division WWE3 bacterium CG_4_9_14_3_um_filter_41_6]
MKKVYIVTCVIIIFWILILVSDTKVLLSETKVKPGEDYYTEEYGNLGENDASSLACKYFNGRKVLEVVFWYSPNNFLGRDSCPFLLRE